MKKPLKNMLMGVVIGIAAIAGASSQARAYSNDYCREYTRTVYIGGRAQEAYGTACQQSDGSWMITNEGVGSSNYDIPADANDVQYVIHDRQRDVVPTRVVYYTQPQINVYRSRPVVPAFVWTHNGYYRGGNYVAYRPYYNNNRNNYRRDNNRRDNDHDRGRGRGRGDWRDHD